MVVKLVGDCCMSDVSVALLNYKVQDRIVVLFFFPLSLLFQRAAVAFLGQSLLFRLANCRFGLQLIYGLFC